MDGLSAHDEMARAIRAAIGLLEDEEMAVAEAKLKAALWALREAAGYANGPAVDMDDVWGTFFRKQKPHPAADCAGAQ